MSADHLNLLYAEFARLADEYVQMRRTLDVVRSEKETRGRMLSAYQAEFWRFRVSVPGIWHE